jgi:hypothetical protein
VVPTEERIICWREFSLKDMGLRLSSSGGGQLSVVPETGVPGNHICALNMFRISELKEE